MISIYLKIQSQFVLMRIFGIFEMQEIILCLQLLLIMEMNIENLLEFCAFYQVNKHASILTLQTIFYENQPSPIKDKPDKPARKKIEVVEKKKIEKTQKVVKPKMQIVAKTNKKQAPQHVKSSNKGGSKDLTYFISHMSGHAQPNNHRNYEQIINTKWNYEISSKPNAQYVTKNYDTFGRSNKTYQYQTFSSKIQKPNTQYSKINYTQKPAQLKSILTKTIPNTDPRLNIYPNETTQASKIKKFWQNTIYDTRRNDKIDFGNLMYSPVRRQNPSPTQSLVFSELREHSMSKSKSKLKRKNSERPFYNASQLTPRDRQNQTKPRKQYEQSVLSNSFVSTQQMRLTNNKKAIDDEGRRQTSTTTYGPKNGKINPRKEAFQNDLDDGMEEIISHLASEQRNAPIAISLVSRQGKM